MLKCMLMIRWLSCFSGYLGSGSLQLRWDVCWCLQNSLIIWNTCYMLCFLTLGILMVLYSFSKIFWETCFIWYFSKWRKKISSCSERVRVSNGHICSEKWQPDHLDVFGGWQLGPSVVQTANGLLLPKASNFHAIWMRHWWLESYWNIPY